MKKLLLILLCLPLLTLAQQTYVPDDNFEIALINLGYDTNLDDYVPTANIDTITSLDLSSNWNALNITNTEKTIVKITDMLGQETPYRRNTPLFYIYDDGTVEKRIVIE